MSEPKLYKSAKECWLKFLSLLVSMKYHVWAAATIFVALDVLAPWLWVAFSAAVLGIRGWERFMGAKPTDIVEAPNEEPTVTE